MLAANPAGIIARVDFVLGGKRIITASTSASSTHAERLNIPEEGAPTCPPTTRAQPLGWLRSLSAYILPQLFADLGSMGESLFSARTGFAARWAPHLFYYYRHADHGTSTRIRQYLRGQQESLLQRRRNTHRAAGGTDVWIDMRSPTGRRPPHGKAHTSR